jgi:hypothetical protein
VKAFEVHDAITTTLGSVLFTIANIMRAKGINNM